MFSVGAASNFKQKYTLSDMILLSELFGVEIEWHFFESYYREGVAGSIGGLVKRMVWMIVKSGTTVQNAGQFVLML